MAAAAASCGGDRVVVAAGTTVVDGGLLDAVVAAYEAERGVAVAVTGAATREVLALGERGGADVLVTHAPSQELAFLATHPEARAAPLFSSRFLLVGPPERAAALAGLEPPAALRSVADRGWEFVTRADGSGTHDKEVQLWELAATAPAGEWYLATGQGMGFSLQVADQRDAFILVEEGAYLAAAGTVSLQPVAWDDPAGLAANPYRVIAVTPGPPRALLDWLVSAPGRRAIAAANEAAFGRQVYVP
jgi:tungstate transport system substrate-binding protein